MEINYNPYALKSVVTHCSHAHSRVKNLSLELFLLTGLYNGPLMCVVNVYQAFPACIFEFAFAHFHDIIK